MWGSESMVHLVAYWTIVVMVVLVLVRWLKRPTSAQNRRRERSNGDQRGR